MEIYYQYLIGKRLNAGVFAWLILINGHESDYWNDTDIKMIMYYHYLIEMKLKKDKNLMIVIVT
jgi:hypothetical protein